MGTGGDQRQKHNDDKVKGEGSKPFDFPSFERTDFPVNIYLDERRVSEAFVKLLPKHFSNHSADHFP